MRLALAALGVLLLLTLGAVVPLLAEGGGRPGPADLAALRFTLVQATLSAALSTALAVPLARALARRRFPLRGALVALTGAPFLLPAIVAVLGIAAVWGRSGWISDALAFAGLPRLDIYGLPGVLLGHVFFNLGLVTRMLLAGFAAVPAEHWRLARQLGLAPRAVFRAIEAPVLREVLPGAFLAVFLVAATSFAVALALGGGPAATTLEVAIYEALRFEYAPGRAALLALAQFAVCLVAGLFLLALGKVARFGPGLAGSAEIPAPGGARRALDAAVIALGAGFLALPLFALVRAGAPGIAGMPAEVWLAASRSVLVALPSAALAGTFALVLAAGIARLRPLAPRRARGVEVLAMLGLAASPLVTGTGLFLVLNRVTDPFALALPVTVAVNATMAVPFLMRLLLPAAEAAREDWGRLADSLGLAGRTRFRIALWPRLRRPLGLGLGLAAALSAGDLGVIALFAREGGGTLPFAVYRLMGAYRMEAAAAAALLLLGLSFGLFLLFDLWGRAGDRA